MTSATIEPAVLRPNPADEYFMDEGCFILEASNSARDNELSIALALVEPGVTTRLHRLRDTVERYYVLTGTGRVEIGNTLTEDVAAGDVVLIPAGADQRITNTGTSDLVFLALCTPRFRAENYADTE